MKIILYIGCLLVLASMLFCLYGYWTNRQLQIKHFKFNNLKLPTALNQFKIVHISDIHYPRLRVAEERIISSVVEANPDVIFLTGDTIDRIETVAQTKLPKLLIALTKIAPVYVVAGNHETSSGQLAEWEELIQQSPATYLKDQIVILEKNAEKIAIAGLFETSSDFPYDEKVKLEEVALTTILAHRPERYQNYLANFAHLGPVAIFSGHAHGGQVRLPVIGGLYAPQQGLLPQYTDGLYTTPNCPDCQFFVSRGLGNSRFPFRINNKPVILTIEFTQK